MFISPFSVNALQRNASALGSGGGAVDSPIFSVLGGDSSLSNIPAQLTINGVQQTAIFRFVGASAGASTWTASTGATNLAIGGSGSVPLLLEKSTPLTDAADKAVHFQTGKHYTTGSTSAYDVATATDDIVLEIVFQHVVTGAEQSLCAKYDVATGKGYLVVLTAADTIQAYGCIAHAASGSLVNKAWYHYMVMADRNGNNRAYLNGVNIATTANLNNAQTNTQPFKIGAYGAADAGKSSAAVAAAQAWVAAAGMVGSSADSDAVAAMRFHQLCGTYPIVAAGSYTPTFTRASTAYLDRVIDESTGERKIFKVGAGWPRVCRRKNGSVWVNGLLSEGSATNRLLQSETFSDASWTKLNCTATGGTTAVNDSTNAFGITPAVGTSTHAIQQTVAGSTDYVSIFAKKGANDYMGIRLNSGGTDYAIFNLANGTVANTSGSSINATLIDYGNGWYLCGAGPGGGTNQIYFVTTNSASSLSYNETSGASVGTYMFGAMSSNSTQRFSQSYINTAAATASRQQDLLTFVSASNYVTQPGAMLAEIMCPVSASMASAQGVCQAYTDANNTNLVTLSTAGLPTASVVTGAATQVSGAGSTNCRDATVRRVTASFADNDYKLGVDNVSELSDTSCTMPAATTLYIGNTSASLALFGLITSFKVFPKLKL